MGSNRPATIAEVAKAAGVSVATVSRVVNGNYPVKPETRTRVQEAIKELKYVPNIQARELNTRKSKTIGVVVPSLHNMFFAQVIDGIEERVRKDGYSLLLNCAKNDPAQEMECLTAFVSRNVAGVIVISPNTEGLKTDFYENLVQLMPLVFINAYHHVPGACYVANDEAVGTYQALSYLYKLGHRRILFVRGDHSDSYEVKEQVFHRFVQEKELDEHGLVVNIGAGNNVETVDRTTEQLQPLLKSLKVTAILCCNDMMAVGCLNACKREGRRVPEDISIIGYDNTSLSRFVEPKLTTMDQNMYQLGANAAEMLASKIEGGPNKRVVLDNVLIKRESTGPTTDSHVLPTWQESID